MDIDTFIIDAFDRWIASELTTADVRALEEGRKSGFTWDAIRESGFADLLVPEDQGGAGGNLPTAGKLVHLCGRAALPLPLALTMFARSAIAAAGLDVPEGPITFARAVLMEGGGLRCSDVPFGAVAEHILAITADGKAALLAVADGNRSHSGVHGSLQMDVEWARVDADALRAWPVDLLAVGAAVFAGLMAGAVERVLEMSLSYAGERKQFGKPLAAFQAIQQNLAVLAEEAFAVRIAAEQAFSGTSVALLPAAVAKGRASKAVPVINAVGHLVHGAIGITEEFDLQLYTRRLSEWRLSFGGERLWAEVIGTQMLGEGKSVLPFLIAISDAGSTPVAELAS